MTFSFLKVGGFLLLGLTLGAGNQLFAQPGPQDPQNDLAPPIEIPQGLFGNAIQIQGGAVFGGGRSVSVSTQGGVTTTKISEAGKNYTFIEDEEGLAVEYIDRYTKADRDRLEKEHPDLFMHVMAFPDVSKDDEVELVINVKKRIEVDSREDLQEKQPELFKVLEGASNLGGFDVPPIKLMIQGGAGGINLNGRVPLPLPGDPIPAVIEANEPGGRPKPNPMKDSGDK
jgi:hypothetical protein